MDRLARWLARVPCAAIAGGCIAGILCARGGWPIPGAMGPVVLGLFLLSIRRGMLGAGCLVWAVFWTVHGVRIERQLGAEEWLRSAGRADIVVEGTVLHLRDRGGFLPDAQFRISHSARNPADLRGALVGVHGLRDGVKPGGVFLLRGTAVHARPPRNPGEFDRVDWLRSRGLSGELRLSARETVGAPRLRRVLHRFAWTLRLELRERIVAGLDEESAGASLIRGLVLGDRSSGGAELYGAFRESGTMHVFAVSGLHVGLVGLLGWFFMRVLRVPRGWGLWAVLGVMWGYAFITGLRPPALRASLMASVFLLAFAVRRQPSLANSLLASLPLVLLLDSFQLQQVGFQLSYTVVGMIILVAPLLYRPMQRVTEGDPFLPKILFTRWQRWGLSVRRYVCGLLAVSLAAWLGSVPLIAHHFGIVTPVAVLASMVLIPIVFGILSLAVLGLLLGLVAEPLEVALNRLNGRLADGAHALARGFSAAPGSHFEWARGGGWQDGILVFDLRGGDGSIYCGAGDGVLIDGGGEDQFRRVIAPALRRVGVAPHSLVLTHPDGGHAGGLATALENSGARQLLLPVSEAGSPAFRRLLESARGSGCVVQLGMSGMRYPLGDGAELEVLRVADRERGSRADERCMLMRIHWNGWRILVSGDAGFDTERELLESGIDLRSDVWIAGRHPSDYTGTWDFLQAVNPRVIVAGEEHYPPEERLPEWWVETVRSAGIELWRQTETGAVIMDVGTEGLLLSSFLEPERRCLLER